MHTSALIQLPAEPVPRDEVREALPLEPAQVRSRLWPRQEVLSENSEASVREVWVHLPHPPYSGPMPCLPWPLPTVPGGQLLQRDRLLLQHDFCLQSPKISFKPVGWTSLKKYGPDWAWEQLPWDNVLVLTCNEVSPVWSHSTLLTLKNCQFGLGLYMTTDSWNLQNFNVRGAQVEQSC